jgi:hypothetical protein
MVDTFTYIKSIALDITAIWFVGWGLRKRYELDEKLDTRAWTVRIILIVAGFISLFFRSPKFMYVRIIFAGAAAVAIVWPNVAYRISRIGKMEEEITS